MFNLLSLYIVLAGLEFVIAFMLLYYLITVRPKRKALYYFLAYKLLDAIAISGFALFYTHFNYFPFYFCMYLLFVSWYMHAISMVTYQGAVDRRFAKFALGTVLFFSFLYAFDWSAGRWTVIVSDSLAMVLYGGLAWQVARYRRKFKVPYFLSAAFGFFAFINLIRVLSVTLAPQKYNFFHNNTVDTVYFLITIGLVVAGTIAFFLLLSEVDKNEIFEKNRLNQIILEQSPMSILLTDLSGRVIYVNPSLCRITGYTCRLNRTGNCIPR